MKLVVHECHVGSGKVGRSRRLNKECHCDLRFARRKENAVLFAPSLSVGHWWYKGCVGEQFITLLRGRQQRQGDASVPYAHTSSHVACSCNVCFSRQAILQLKLAAHWCPKGRSSPVTSVVPPKLRPHTLSLTNLTIDNKPPEAKRTSDQRVTLL